MSAKNIVKVCWRVLSVVAVAVTVLIGSVARVGATDFSISGAAPPAPAIPDAATLRFTGGALTVVLPPTSLGSPPAPGVVDAFSYGYDRILPLSAGGTKVIRFSVTPGSAGASGSVVSTEVGSNGAAGDIFQASSASGPGSFGAPTKFVDATGLGLTPLPVPQSDVDGLNWNLFFGTKTPPQVYFSVDPPTALAMGVSPADILYVPSPFMAAPIVWASAAALGLGPTDDIDALMVRDVQPEEGVIRRLRPDGMFTPAGTPFRDIVQFSLTPASPTLAAALTSPALGFCGGAAGKSTGATIFKSPAIIPTPPACPATIVAFPADLGLLSTDDVNAATIFIPRDLSGTASRWHADSAIEIPASGGSTTMSFTLELLNPVPGIVVEFEPDLGGGQASIAAISGSLTMQGVRRSGAGQDHIIDLNLISSNLVGASVNIPTVGDTGLNTQVYTSLEGTLDINTGQVDLLGSATISNDIYPPSSPIVVNQTIQTGILNIGTGQLDMVTTASETLPVDIPAVSDWGLVAMTLLVLTAATVVLLRRRAGMGKGSVSA